LPFENLLPYASKITIDFAQTGTCGGLQAHELLPRAPFPFQIKILSFPLCKFNEKNLFAKVLHLFWIGKHSMYMELVNTALRCSSTMAFKLSQAKRN